MGKALGTFRAFSMTAISCIASFMFAYDTGVIGGVLTLKSFQDDFRYGKEQKAAVGSNSTSLLQAGGELKSTPALSIPRPRSPPLDPSVLY